MCKETQTRCTYLPQVPLKIRLVKVNDCRLDTCGHSTTKVTEPCDAEDHDDCEKTEKWASSKHRCQACRAKSESMRRLGAEKHATVRPSMGVRGGKRWREKEKKRKQQWERRDGCCVIQ
nr:hypothetical protein CFP56_10989 [Quercus suber]